MKHGLLFFIMLMSAGVSMYAQQIVFTPQWTPQSQFAGYYVAQEMGFYKDAGVDVVIDHTSTADLVINRAGSMTLSELQILGKPCILIPSPNVTDNHQYKNAKVLADRGGALLIEEKDLKEGVLAQAVSELLADEQRLKRMSEAMSSMAMKNAGEKIYNLLISLVKKENM